MSAQLRKQLLAEYRAVEGRQILDLTERQYAGYILAQGKESIDWPYHNFLEFGADELLYEIRAQEEKIIHESL